MAATYKNLDQWKARAENIRKQILTGANLYPLPKRTPLNAVVNKKRSYEEYTVESAAFEARPGHFRVWQSLSAAGQEGAAHGHPLSARTCPWAGWRTITGATPPITRQDVASTLTNHHAR